MENASIVEETKKHTNLTRLERGVLVQAIRSFNCSEDFNTLYVIGRNKRLAAKRLTDRKILTEVSDNGLLLIVRFNPNN